MNNQKPAGPYVPVYCRKCKAQNNLAATKICRNCGACLEDYDRAGGSSISGGGGLSEFFPVRYLAALALIGVLGVAGAWYLQGGAGVVKVSSPNTPVGAAAPTETTLSVENTEVKDLPADSWYQKSLWSYFRKLPTARQVLEKNSEVSGRRISPDSLETIYLKGEAGLARGDCFIQSCLDNSRGAAPRNINEMYRLVNKHILPKERPVFSDDYNRDYGKLGPVEIAAARDGKLSRRIRVYAPDQSESVEVHDGSDGRTAWRKTTRFNGYGKIVESNLETPDETALAKLKNEVKSNLFEISELSEISEVKKLVRVHHRTAFLLSRTTPAGKTKQFYFDAATGHLIKTDDGEFSVYFLDHRDLQGSQVPYLIYYRRAELGGFHSWMILKISEWKLNEVFDQAIFEAPPAG